MSTDPRRPAAVVAVREHLAAHGHDDLSQVSVQDVVDVVLATLPAATPGQLAVIRLAERAVDDQDQRAFAELARLLDSTGIKPVFIVGADLDVLPEPEEAWRAAWTAQTAELLTARATKTRNDAGRAAEPADEHALRVAADVLEEAAREVLDGLNSEDTPPNQ